MITINKRPKLAIGLLIGNLYGTGGYYNEVWKGIKKAAEAENVNLICFCGGTINESPVNPYESYRNIIYSFINKKLISGIVFVGVTLGIYTSTKEYEKFCKSLRPLPLVSLGGPVFDYTSVLIDNKSGFYELIKHLIIKHGYKNIAFIKGSEGNKDAQERFEVYKKVLKDHAIQFNEKLVYYGDFSGKSGSDCIKELLDERKVKFDALVASNDSMALGAILELKKRNVKIPLEIAVTGFDDVQAASAVYPPLSTVWQPISKQCEEAVRILLKKINGENFLNEKIPTEPIYRKSCGCQSREDEKNLAKNENIISSFENVEHKKQELKETIVNILGMKKYGDYSKFIDDLIENLIYDIKNTSSISKFLSSLDFILQESLKYNIPTSIFQKIISVIRNTFFDYFYQDRNDFIKIENIFQQAISLVSEITISCLTQEKLSAEQESFIMDEISLFLTSTFDKNELLKILVAQISRLGIDTIFISLFEDDDYSKSNLVLAFQNGKQILIPEDSIVYDSYDLLPPYFDKELRFSLILFPLYFRKNYIGTLLIDGNSTKGLIYESLFIKLSSAFQASLIFKKNLENQEILKNKNTQIQNFVNPMIESINKVFKITNDKVVEINEIKKASKESETKIFETANAIGRASKDMNNMLNLVKVIDDIAAKINIIALNASIEATHVGNQGRGFSVISGEIRKLSESTKKNADEISKAINIINLSIKDSVSTVLETQKNFTDLEKGISSLMDSLQLIGEKMKLMEESSKELLELMSK